MSKFVLTEIYSYGQFRLKLDCHDILRGIKKKLNIKIIRKKARELKTKTFKK